LKLLKCEAVMWHADRCWIVWRLRRRCHIYVVWTHRSVVTGNWRGRDNCTTLCGEWSALLRHPRFTYFLISELLLYMSCSNDNNDSVSKSFHICWVCFQLGMPVTCICEHAIAYAICDRIFCKNPHIAYFLHIIAFSKSHMRKLCRICESSHICCIFCIFVAIFGAYFAKFRIFSCIFSCIFCIKVAQIFY